MAMAVMLFTSCLKNEEPQSLGTLREAKAELIKAQAAYKTAEIALIQAQVAYQAALTEGIKVQNELKAQAVEAAKINNKIKEVELAIKEAGLEAEIAKLEAELARQEAALAKIQQDMEYAAALHEANMIAAMQAIAEAQQDYEQALKMIQAENLGLTKEQADMIKGYVEAIVELQDEAQDLQDEIAEKSAELQNRVLDNDYESILADAEFDVYYNQYMAALMQAYAAQMEQILTSGEYEEVKAKAAEEEAHLALYKDSIDVYNKQLSTIDDQVVKLEADRSVADNKYVAPYKAEVVAAQAAWTKAYNKNIEGEGAAMTKAVAAAAVPVKFDYDPALEAELKDVFATGTFKNGVYTGATKYPVATYTASTDEKKHNPENFIYNFTLKSSYSAVNAAFDEAYKAVYADLHISPAKIAEYEAIKAGATTTFAALEKAYKADKALFDSIQPIAIAKANAYKVGAAKDLQATTKAAWNAYWAKDQAKVTIAEAEALRDAVVKYLKDRQELDAQAVLVNLNINGNDVPTPLASVLFNDYVAAKDLLVSYKVDCQWALDRPSLTIANATDPKALLNQWNTLSASLYGTPDGKPLVMPIEDYFQDFASQVVVKLDNDGKVGYDYLADKGVAKFDFEDMGYDYTVSNVEVEGVVRGYKVTGFCDGLWFEYHAAAAKQTANYLIDLQDEVDAALESINAHKAADPVQAFAKVTEAKATADAAMDVVSQALADAEEELEAAQEQYLGSIDKQIEALEKDAEAIEKAINLINIKVGACTQILEKYMVLLNGMVPGGSFETTAAFEKYVTEVVDSYLDQAELYLMAAEEAAEYLERVQMGIDEATVAYENELNRLTTDLAQLEDELEMVLGQIEYYQELLNNTLAVFVGE